jgi:hypothetical protein
MLWEAVQQGDRAKQFLVYLLAVRTFGEVGCDSLLVGDAELLIDIIAEESRDIWALDSWLRHAIGRPEVRRTELNH